MSFARFFGRADFESDFVTLRFQHDQCVVADLDDIANRHVHFNLHADTPCRTDGNIAEAEKSGLYQPNMPIATTFLVARDREVQIPAGAVRDAVKPLKSRNLRWLHNIPQFHGGCLRTRR